MGSLCDLEEPKKCPCSLGGLSKNGGHGNRKKQARRPVMTQQNQGGPAVGNDCGANGGMLFIILQRDDALSTQFSQHTHFQHCTDPQC